MTGVTIGTDGLITALYSNGMFANLGQICVGTFANAMGLENAGDNLYQATANSGDVSIVDIKASGTGTLTTGVLENVQCRPVTAVYRHDHNPERLPGKQPYYHNLRLFT